jgi:RNA polymerase sigma factor (sigma-70 family)
MSQANGRAAIHEMEQRLRPARPYISPRGEGRPLTQPSKQARFEQAVMPHLDAAYNLARWLTRDEHDAEDVVQEAYLRAFRFFDGFHGGDGRSWLLAVVRNTCYTWLRRNRPPAPPVAFDESVHAADDAFNPETLFLQGAARELLREELGELPSEFREVVVLRELEGLSYKEIAAVTEAPLGTVMSRLARGRGLLRARLARRLHEEA